MSSVRLAGQHDGPIPPAEHPAETRPPVTRAWRLVDAPPPKPRRRWGWAWLAAALVVLTILLICVSRSAVQRAEVVVLRLAPRVTLELVAVPAGEFRMGAANNDPDAYYDELPQHTVFLDEYLIGRYEVTVAQYRAFVRATGYLTAAEREGWAFAWTGSDWGPVEGANWQHPRGPSSRTPRACHPVTQVSWQDAVAFCRWASQITGRDVRLPTEAQWEKAARGTQGNKYPWGTAARGRRLLNLADCNLSAGWAETSLNDGHEFTAPVGSYPAGASPYGALDMSGNVMEWVADWYAPHYYAVSPTANPAGPEDGDEKVMRGGSWGGCFRVVRAAARLSDNPQVRYDSGGFRVAVVSD